MNKNALNKTFIVMGWMFVITLILNLFLDIEFYSTSASIAYLAFGLVYYGINHLRDNK